MPPASPESSALSVLAATGSCASTSRWAACGYAAPASRARASSSARAAAPAANPSHAMTRAGRCARTASSPIRRTWKRAPAAGGAAGSNGGSRTGRCAPAAARSLLTSNWSDTGDPRSSRRPARTTCRARSARRGTAAVDRRSTASPASSHRQSSRPASAQRPGPPEVDVRYTRSTRQLCRAFPACYPTGAQAVHQAARVSPNRLSRAGALPQKPDLPVPLPAVFGTAASLRVLYVAVRATGRPAACGHVHIVDSVVAARPIRSCLCR